MRHPSLELDDPPEAQGREWSSQAVGLVLLVAPVVAALLGVFGHGPVSWGEETSASGELEIAAPRFARRGGTTSMAISADASLASGSVFRVVFEQRYADALGFERLEPSPDSVQAVRDELVYLVARAGEDADLQMTIDLTPDALWSVSGAVRVGEQRVTLDHFIFP